MVRDICGGQNKKTRKKDTEAFNIHEVTAQSSVTGRRPEIQDEVQIHITGRRRVDRDVIGCREKASGDPAGEERSQLRMGLGDRQCAFPTVLFEPTGQFVIF